MTFGRHGMNLGADDYITKPFTRLQLLKEAIQSRLGKYAAREQLYQQELNQLHDALAEEQEQRLLKARMVAMFSHDFRNPSTIMSSNNLLRDYADRMDAERRETHFNRIETSVRQLIQMLDDILIVSQMETGHLYLKAERLDVGAFFQQVVEEFQAISGDSHTIVFENHVKTSSMADTRLLRQIISNLLSNAIKYSPHGTTVRITLDLKDSNYLLTVKIKASAFPKKIKSVSSKPSNVEKT